MDIPTKMSLIAKEKKLRMLDLSVIFNKAPSTINNYLSGKTDIPLSFFIQFCDYFKIPYISLLSDLQEHQYMKVRFDNSVVENQLRKEISELKDRIIQMQESKLIKASMI